MTRAIQACCAALLAALAIAPGAQAATDPSCPPPDPPGTPIAVTAPQALAQTFVLTEQRAIIRVSPVAGDRAQGNARVQVTRTLGASGLPGEVLREVLVPLPADPAAVDVTLTPPLQIGPGTYAIVVDPPGAESAVAWTRCGDQTAGGARFRTLEPSWVELAATRLAFWVTTQDPDLTAPETTITSAPPAFTAAPTVQIEFSANEAVAFRCAIDGARAVDCVSPLVLTPAEGRHEVAVTAIDAAGNVDPTPAVAAFTSDGTAPVLDLPEPMDVWATSDDGAVVTYDASAEDALDPSPTVSCTPPSGSALPQGATTVACSAVDAAGNTATGSFLVTVRPDPGKAELSAQWNPKTGKIALSEPRGGTVTMDRSAITATRGAHTTRFTYRSGYEYSHGHLRTALQLRTVGYDDADATSLRRTFYAVRDAVQNPDDSVRSATIVASAGARSVAISYRGSSKTTRIVWCSGDRPRVETRRGLWVPRIRSVNGSSTLELVNVSPPPAAAQDAEGNGADADALGDALQRLVVNETELAQLKAAPSRVALLAAGRRAVTH